MVFCSIAMLVYQRVVARIAGFVDAPSKFPMDLTTENPNKKTLGDIPQASLHPPNEIKSFINSWLGVWDVFFQGMLETFLD